MVPVSCAASDIFFAFGDNFSVLFFQSIKRAENTENRCVREKHAVKSVKGEKQL